MKSIANQLNTQVTTKARSERSFLIEEIIFELAKSNSFPTKDKHCARIMGVKLAHIPTDSLRDFFQDCRRYCREKPSYPFGKIFWGKLK